MTTSTAPWQRDEQGNDMVSIPEICGPSWWAMLHGWAKAIETDGCPSCGGFAVKAASALHDLTNIKLGKPVHDQDNFLELAGYYTNAALKLYGEPALAQDTLVVYHGTTASKLESIRANGLEPPTGTGPLWFMVTSNFDWASFHTTGGENSIVIEYTLPHEEATPRTSEFLWKGNPVSSAFGEGLQYALKSPLPGELITHVFTDVRRVMPARMSQPPPTVTITGKCSGDTEQCDFKVKSTKTTESVTGSISAIPDAVDEVRRRALEAERNLIPGDGLTFAFGALSGTQYDFRFQILEVTDLIPSNDPFTFAPSPNYPQELQPRLRDRASLRLQVETLAANLNADLLLTDFHSLDRGAPIIGPDMVVESGNGRAMALIRAAQDQPESYGRYRDALAAQAPDFGFSGVDVRVQFDSPVLVRLRLTDVNRIEFVQEANLSPAISSSAVETALTDSAFITPGLLSSLVISEGQGIDEALRATRNTPFTSGFLAALPSQEQAKLVDADGRLNQDGVRRITMAIFSRAFPGESGLRLVENFFESTDANVKNVFNGILMSLGDLVQAETMALTGDRDPELSVGEDLAKGVGVFATIKATPGMTVENFLAQSQLFERSLTPFQETVLKSLDARSRSSRRVGELLGAYAKIVLDQPAPAQGTLIDIERITKEQAWAQAEQASAEPVTGTLFQNSEGSMSNIFLAQEPPEVRITGKCEGEDVEGNCEFRVKRVETTVKVQGIQAAIDAATDIIESTRSGNGRPSGGAGPAEVRPLTVELAGGTFNFAPETLIEMSAIANQTSKKERGFALCQDVDGMIRPGLRCLGGTCSIRIEDCVARKQVGIFHTHPNDQPSEPAQEAIRQRTFSSGDLMPMSRRRDNIMCVSGSRVGVITCAVAKPGAPSLGQIPRATYPYIHPDTPESLKRDIKHVKLTPSGRVSKSQFFNPQVGRNYDFVEFDKVGPGTLQQEPFASLGQDDDGLTEFALSLDVGGQGDFVSERVADPVEFADGSIRSVRQNDHVIRVGCPKGQWDGRQCEVGMKAQSILHPRSEESELITDAFNREIPVLGEPMLQELDELIQSVVKEDELVASSDALV